VYVMCMCGWYVVCVCDVFPSVKLMLDISVQDN